MDKINEEIEKQNNIKLQGTIMLSVSGSIIAIVIILALSGYYDFKSINDKINNKFIQYILKLLFILVIPCPFVFIAGLYYYFSAYAKIEELEKEKK